MTVNQETIDFSMIEAFCIVLLISRYTNRQPVRIKVPDTDAEPGANNN